MAALSAVAKPERFLSFAGEVNLAMRLLADDPRTIFVGQSVAWDGARIHQTLEGVPQDKRLEMPVIEDFQLGFCIGLSLQGRIPICIYPRFDFLILAANQLVNHLDKIPLMGDYRPRVIVRTAVGKKTPLDAGPQHTNDHTEAFRLMLKTVKVVELTKPEEVVSCYVKALRSDESWLIVENG